MSAFRVEVLPCGEICTLILHGEADLAVADNIVEQGTSSLADTATVTLIIDMGQVTFIDSTALGALIRLRNFADAAAKQLVLTRLPDRVKKVLDIAGLGSVFDVRPGE
jgi:stage II sporulation protein AA (anti-sigma F factor antagonist)